MAVTISQQRKKQNYLILVFIFVVLLTSFVVWKGFFSKKLKPPTEIEEFPKPAEIKINFEILKSPILKELQPFEEILPFEEEIGRENPFIPY